MIRKTSDEQFAKVYGDLRGEMSAAEPAMVNVEQATTFHHAGYVELLLKHRRRVFRVPPVPYATALRLLYLDRTLARLRRAVQADDNDLEAIAAMAPVVEEIATTMYALVRPVTLFDRLFWRWLANPFLGMEATEMYRLRDFFCAARTRCRVRWAASSRAPRWLTSTWPPNSHRLSSAFRAGFPAASPVAGGTTGLALLK